ncbi:hypothetical protein D8674_012870 [Pyrus ussuriensis x Pyrus communis]|uniref:Uncharacterized protein n=1 Tax=Pyrus ussuriensis x Pyrus communis TaxID=2448454 RepID=A0A5N5GSX1_9ROSA|nr:hypothetical protein D8674_012870 [Pyrus ussuriensis x Pyrus communis]
MFYTKRLRRGITSLFDLKNKAYEVSVDVVRASTGPKLSTIGARSIFYLVKKYEYKGSFRSRETLTFSSHEVDQPLLLRYENKYASFSCRWQLRIDQLRGTLPYIVVAWIREEGRAYTSHDGIGKGRAAGVIDRTSIWNLIGGGSLPYGGCQRFESAYL